jgi:hypothetical protein
VIRECGLDHHHWLVVKDWHGHCITVQDVLAALAIPKQTFLNARTFHSTLSQVMVHLLASPSFASLSCGHQISLMLNAHPHDYPLEPAFHSWTVAYVEALIRTVLLCAR